MHQQMTYEIPLHARRRMARSLRRGDVARIARERNFSPWAMYRFLNGSNSDMNQQYWQALNELLLQRRTIGRAVSREARAFIPASE